MLMTDQVVQQSSNFEAKKIAFELGDPVMIQAILRDRLYTNKLRVVIQEYASNGRDAHRAAGIANRPIEIKLPTPMDPSLVIRDFGAGISPEKIRDVFVKFGTSDKRNDACLTGGFGIGAKCGLAYTESFMVTTIAGGLKYIYLAHIESSGMSALSLIDESVVDDTVEPGTAISIKVKAEDFERCTNYVNDLFRMWAPRPDIVVDLQLTATEPSDAVGDVPRRTEFVWGVLDLEAVEFPDLGGCRKNLSLALIGNGQWVGYVDGLPYAITTQLGATEKPSNTGFLVFKTGELEINANRETLRETAANTTMVQQRFSELLTALREQAKWVFREHIFFGNPLIQGPIEAVVSLDNWSMVRDTGFDPYEVDGDLKFQSVEYSESKRGRNRTLKKPAPGAARASWHRHCQHNPQSLTFLVAPKVGWQGLRETIIAHFGFSNRHYNARCTLIRCATIEGYAYLKQFCGPKVVMVDEVRKTKVIRAARETGCCRVFHLGKQRWANVPLGQLNSAPVATVVDPARRMIQLKCNGVAKLVSCSTIAEYRRWVGGSAEVVYAVLPSALRKMTNPVMADITDAVARGIMWSIKARDDYKTNDLGFLKVYLDREPLADNSYARDLGLRACEPLFGLQMANVEFKPSPKAAKLAAVETMMKANPLLRLLYEHCEKEVEDDDDVTGGRLAGRVTVSKLLSSYLDDISRINHRAGKQLKEIIK